MSVETELAWAAGFYDGEGSTHMNNTKGTKRIRVRISQSGDKRVLDRFVNAVSIGYVRGPYNYDTKRLPIYTLDYSSVNAYTVLWLLWPYLGDVKKEQAMTVLESEVHRPGMSMGEIHARKTHCKNGHEYSEENTYIRPEGGRTCRICRQKNVQRSRAGLSKTRDSSSMKMALLEGGI